MSTFEDLLVLPLAAGDAKGVWAFCLSISTAS